MINKVIDIILYLVAAIVIISIVAAVEMRKSKYEEMIKEIDEQEIRSPIAKEKLPSQPHSSQVNFAIDVDGELQQSKQIRKNKYYRKKLIPNLFKRR